MTIPHLKTAADQVFKLDLHTHTFCSGDSTTTYEDFIEKAVETNLAAVAITDHLSIEGAQWISGNSDLNVIIGQEFRTREGEVIGLFLKERVVPGLTLVQASESIRAQGGLVYIPHPGDRRRASLSFDTLEAACSEGLVDIVEVGNSKIQDPILISRAGDISCKYGICSAASSDAHVAEALGSSFTGVDRLPYSAAILLEALRTAELHWTFHDPPRPWKPRIIPSRLEG